MTQFLVPPHNTNMPMLYGAGGIPGQNIQHILHGLGGMVPLQAPPTMGMGVGIPQSSGASKYWDTARMQGASPMGMNAGAQHGMGAPNVSNILAGLTDYFPRGGVGGTRPGGTRPGGVGGTRPGRGVRGDANTDTVIRQPARQATSRAPRLGAAITQPVPRPGNPPLPGARTTQPAPAPKTTRLAERRANAY